MKKSLIALALVAAMSVPAFAQGQSCSFCGPTVVNINAQTSSTASGLFTKAWGESFVSGATFSPSGTTQFQLEAGHLATSVYGSASGNSGLSYFETRSAPCNMCGKTMTESVGSVGANAWASDPHTEAYGQMNVQGVTSAPSGFTNFGYATGFDAVGSYRANGNAQGVFTEQRVGNSGYYYY